MSNNVGTFSKWSCLKKDTNQISGKERRAVVILAIVFLIVLTSYISIQNLQSSINEEDGLGVTSLMCVYIASGVSCFVAPLAIRLVSVKGMIIISCMVHLLYACCNFYPMFWTIVPASVLLGTISGPLWTAQGMYITICAYIHTDRSTKNPSHVLGKYFGTFFGIYVWSNIIGNLMSSLLLNLNRISNDENNTNVSQVYNLTIHQIGRSAHRCGVHYCPKFSDFEHSTSAKLDTEYFNYLLCLFVAFVTVGLAISILILPPMPKSAKRKENTSAISSILSTVKLLRDPTMSLLCPSVIAYALAEAFRWTDVSHVRTCIEFSH